MSKGIREIKSLNYYLIFVFALCVIGCNPVRHAYKEPIKEKGADYIFEQLKKHELKFAWFSTKFSTDVYYGKKKNSLSGTLRIKKDSAIWVSITPILGIEVARVLITTDSVKILNRTDNTCFLGNFKYIYSLLKTEFDFDMLQSFIIGNDFTYYENDKFKATIENKQYKLSTVGRGKLKKFVHGNENMKILLQDIWLEPDSFKITKSLIKELKENRKLEARYSDFKDIGGQMFPLTEKFEINADKKEMKINIDFERVSVNKVQELPFNIPSKYTIIYEYGKK
jgi:hypothetical protein